MKQALALQNYAQQVRSFQPNARLYLLFVIVSGAAFGIFRLLFNFYVISLGYNESLLGTLITINNGVALFLALPIGYLGDRLGRKRSMLLGAVTTSLSVLLMVAFPSRWIFFAMNGVLGMAQSLMAVTTAPFLMENSSEKERTYLFSFSFGLQTLAGFVGNLAGGYLPGWFGAWQNVDPTSSTAYAGALLGVVSISFLGIIPIFFIRRNFKSGDDTRSSFAPLSYFWSHKSSLGKLILPMFVTSIGAGMVMPFMNIFYRNVYQRTDPEIGSLMAWGALGMALGLLLSPVFAERMGKIQFVVWTQALSIPFLIVLGFGPFYWMSAGAYLVRLALMNMSNPVYQAFVMEHVEKDSRATVSSLVSMAWNFGWAISPSVSGDLQVTYGFGPPFLITIVLYCLAVFLYWAFFWRGQLKPVAETAAPSQA